MQGFWCKNDKKVMKMAVLKEMQSIIKKSKGLYIPSMS
jgi:hypothetical protein